MKTPIIDQRIQELRSKKDKILRMKKHLRPSTKTLDQTINRLNRWKKELST